MRGTWYLRCCKLLLASIFLLSGCREAEQTDFQEVTLLEDTAEHTQENEEDSEPEEICVYVCGEVQFPGVYVLEADSRICDALEAAGGMTEEAAETYLNQAQVLTDGEKIYLPSTEEAAQGTVQESSGISSGTDADAGKVSINQADKEELMTLPGIGETKAEAIIAYRERNGGFDSLQDLMQVEGIKEGTYQKLEAFIQL